MKKVTLLSLLLLFTGILKAQETCIEKLYNANRLFEKGQISEAVEIAKTCATESNSVTEQWQAYRLLANAYLFNNQMPEARKAAEKMMELNPTYSPGTRDSKDLANLLKTVKVIPKLSIGLNFTAGINQTFPNVFNDYNGATYNKNYSSKNSWHVGLMVGQNLNEIISLHTGLIASSKKFGISYSLEGKDVMVNENLTYFDLPVFARFSTPPKNGWSLFGDVGMYVGRMASSKSSFSIRDTLVNRFSDNINSEVRRNMWEYGALCGVGAKYKFKQRYVSLDVRYYMASFYNVTNDDKRYDHSSLFYNYYYLDDDFRLNNLAVSLSLVQFVNYKVIKESFK